MELILGILVGFFAKRIIKFLYRKVSEQEEKEQ